MNEHAENQFPLKRTPVLLAFFLNFITAGFYYCYWFLSRRDGFNKLSKSHEFGKNIFIACIVLITIEIALIVAENYFYFTNNGVVPEPIETVYGVLDKIARLILFLQCFKARAILDEHQESKRKSALVWSWILTFIFQIFYIQFRINKIHKE